MKLSETEHENILKAIGASREQDEFIPYLLQDLWALGSCPEKQIELIRKTNLNFENALILDLGCGKGAAAITIAKELGARVTGVDGYSAFIEEAKQKAKEYKVESLTSFIYDDIKNYVLNSDKYDLIILSSVGSLWGKWCDTISKISSCLKDSGFLIIDEGFITEGINDNYLTYTEILNQLNESSFRLVEEIIYPSEMLLEENKTNNNFICKRAEEIIAIYPEKKSIIEDYIKAQFEECEFLEKYFRCAAWLLQKCL